MSGSNGVQNGAGPAHGAVRVVVIGAGISGLALAFELLEQAAEEGMALDLRVVESATRPGGPIHTELVEGYQLEWGVNGFLDSAPDTLRLVERLGMQSRLLRSSDAARLRSIMLGGRLQRLPESPPAFLKSNLLSLRGRLRVIQELVRGDDRPRGIDETIRDFGIRRLGVEVADTLLDAFVGGVFAGDPAQLSLAAAFPRLTALEKTHGSLLRGLIGAQLRGGVRRGELTSFVGGMGELVQALAARLGGRLLLGSLVRGIVRQGGAYSVELGGERLMADAVVLATPAPVSAELCAALDPPLCRVLNAIPYAPLAVVALGYEAALGRSLPGFGYLIPACEGRQTLGSLFDSNVYPGRAPVGRVLVRVMMGGARRPELVELDDAELLARAREDLSLAIGQDPEPRFVRILRHRRGIPQYTVGHLGRVDLAQRRLELWPGLHLAGNAYRGVAVNDCVREAGPLAARVLRELRARAGRPGGPHETKGTVTRGHERTGDLPAT